MFQKFFTDTIMSRFIKNLLSKEEIPLLDCVHEGDVVLKDCLYIYDHFIIKCVEEGKLLIEKSDYLYPSENLYPSIMLFPGTGEKCAKFKVVSHYDGFGLQKCSYKYKSTTNYYDSDTHKHLGNYLRFLREYYHLDLMPYYNCYNYHVIDDVYLIRPTYETLYYPSPHLYPSVSLYPGMINNDMSTYAFGTIKNYKVLAVPIKFNKKYTIAIDSSTEVLLRSVLYGSSGMVKVRDVEDTYYSDDDDLVNSFLYKPSTSFQKPFTYEVPTDNIELYQRQRDLYLLIQIPSSNTSSVVVLEGDYTSLDKLSTDVDSVKELGLHPNLSLLMMNTKESYAFSDRLIEYLLLNVVTHRDAISGNVEKVQRALYKLDEDYKRLIDSNKSSWGVWDSYIQGAVLRVIDNNSGSIYFRDQDGYINKDVEDLFLRKGGYS